MLKKSVSLAVRPMVKSWFGVYRWYRHNEFLRDLESPVLGGPDALSRPLIFTVKASKKIAKVWRDQFVDYALNRYVSFIPKHYAKSGLGYFNLDSLSEEQCVDKFNSLQSRIVHYIDNNPTLMSYRDGESFLDVGCGMGQTIKELVKRYPSSKIKAFDVNEPALRVIRCGTQATNKVEVEVGSVTDFEYLKSYASGSFDHVIMSHVLPHIVAPSLEETHAQRQHLIDELVRIARKSVLVMDPLYHSPEDEVLLFIEQKNRCQLIESEGKYFQRYRTTGELYAMFGPENSAIIFKKR